MNKLISIIVPCYNQAQYLDECLQSVLDQIYSEWECIIVDDGSPDNTEDIALKWTKKDIRFKYLKKENGGVSNARNVGIESAKGQYILPLDADDKISADYVSEAIKVFEKNPETTLVYCKAWLFGCKEKLLALPDSVYPNILFYNCIFCSAVFKKEDWSNIGGYDESLLYGVEDWDFWLKLLNVDSKIVRLNIIGFFYRIKEENSRSVSFWSSENKRKEMVNCIFKKHMSAVASYYDRPFLDILKKYTLFDNKVHELSEDYIGLSERVKISILFKAILLRLKRSFFKKLKTAKKVF